MSRSFNKVAVIKIEKQRDLQRINHKIIRSKTKNEIKKFFRAQDYDDLDINIPKYGVNQYDVQDLKKFVKKNSIFLRTRFEDVEGFKRK